MSLRSDLIFNYLIYTSSFGAVVGLFPGLNAACDSITRHSINNHACRPSCHICIIYNVCSIIGIPVMYSITGATIAITAPVSIPVILKYFNHHRTY